MDDGNYWEDGDTPEIRPYVRSRKASLYTAERIPSVATLRPCDVIHPEASGDGVGTVGIVRRYRTLTRNLPLAGGAALTRDVDGVLTVVEALHSRAPWMGAALDVVERQLELQLWAGRPWAALRPMLLVGPPGSGKSRFAADLGGALGLHTVRINMAGTSDARMLEGTARGWTNAQPCLPAVAMAQSATANPMVLCEEADKAGGSRSNGDPLRVLLTMVERHTAKAWYDGCLMAPVDLSAVIWVLTANTLAGIPAPLLSRLTVVTVDGPGFEHFDELLKSVLLDLASDWGMTVADLPDLHDHVREELRWRFGRERSARGLALDVEAALGSVVRLGGRFLH